MRARRDYNVLGSYERRFSLMTRVVRDKTKCSRKGRRAAKQIKENIKCGMLMIKVD